MIYVLMFVTSLFFLKIACIFRKNNKLLFLNSDLSIYIKLWENINLLIPFQSILGIHRLKLVSQNI